MKFKLVTAGYPLELMLDLSLDILVNDLNVSLTSFLIARKSFLNAGTSFLIARTGFRRQVS